jgi:hypothetical protein
MSNGKKIARDQWRYEATRRSPSIIVPKVPSIAILLVDGIRPCSRSARRDQQPMNLALRTGRRDGTQTL